MNFKGISALALAAGLLASGPALASYVERTTLAPAKHHAAQLVIVDDAGVETVYTPEDLEALGAYRMTTRTPWRPEAAVFEGVLLSDLLRRHGLDDNDVIHVLAENDFRSDIERVVWSSADVMVATRVNGVPHNRRERGPIQIVVHEEQYEGQVDIGERHLVWMVARIEPAR